MWLGWALLIALAITTAVHAISITMHHTHLDAQAGNLFSMIRIAGVVLVELFAVATAALLASHKLRAKQKPAALAVELTWVIFAGINLISSFAIEHGGEVPAFVSSWVTYGLPISALLIGVLFYAMLRFDPSAKRADDDAELAEKFTHIQHKAKLEVMASPQMNAVIRQMMWQQLPPVIGRRLNLTEAQIAALVQQAPQLLDLNRNGVPDIYETPGRHGNERIAAAAQGERPEPVHVSYNGREDGSPGRPTPGR
jgi:cytochrome bd-type quinol oxidase subunit 2